jgi:hypothetical protein
MDTVVETLAPSGDRPAPLRPRLDLVSRLLRDGDGLALELREGPRAAAWIGPLAGVTAIGAGLFGLAIGLPGGPLQALLSAVKLPLVMLGSAALTLPLLHVSSARAGLRLAPERLSALLLQAMATATTTMSGLAPLALVFWLSLSLLPGSDLLDAEWYAYRRFVLAVAAVGALGGLVGAARLLRELPIRAALPWAVGLGLAGLQLSWLLRPVIGSPGPLVLLRPLEGSGLGALLDVLVAILGG